jgi:hypothetical protein
MLRYLRIAVSVVSLVACVLMIALWVRSYFVADRIHLPCGSKEAIAIGWKQGRSFVVRYETVPQPNACQSGWYSHRVSDMESFPMGERSSSSLIGFDLLRRPPYFIPELSAAVPGRQGFTTT